MITRALLLVGSPRTNQSNSLQIGSYLTDRLQEKGAAIEKLYLARQLDSEEGRQQLLTAVDAADLLILAFPLYIDCLPTQTIRALELIRDYREAFPKRQKFFAIVNCGFPEPHQNQVAADICKRFAAETGFEWMGCARVGFGMAVMSKPLRENKIAGKLMKGLDQAAELLAEGRPLTPKAEAKLFLPMVPVWLARIKFVPGNQIWDKRATPYALEHMDARPYQQ